MPTAKQWFWIGTGVAALFVGAVSQAVSANIRPAGSVEPATVLVEFLAPGNAVRATVNWTTPEGSQTYRGELPLMNTKGSQGIAYRLPAGSAVSMSVTNAGSTAVPIWASLESSPAVSRWMRTRWSARTNTGTTPRDLLDSR